MVCAQINVVISGQYIAAIYNNFEYFCKDVGNCEASNMLRNDFPSYFNTNTSDEPFTFEHEANVGIAEGLSGAAEIQSLDRAFMPLVFLL